MVGRKVDSGGPKGGGMTEVWGTEGEWGGTGIGLGGAEGREMGTVPKGGPSFCLGIDTTSALSSTCVGMEISSGLVCGGSTGTMSSNLFDKSPDEKKRTLTLSIP